MQFEVFAETRRIIEKRESGQIKSLDLKPTSYPYWVGGELTSLLACWDGCIIRSGLGFRFSVQGLGAQLVGSSLHAGRAIVGFGV